VTFEEHLVALEHLNRRGHIVHGPIVSAGGLLQRNDQRHGQRCGENDRVLHFTNLLASEWQPAGKRVAPKVHDNLVES
jgi:hypothetical protein